MTAAVIDFDIDVSDSVVGRYSKANRPVLQAQADTLLARGEYRRAIKTYTEALAYDKTNKRCLLNLSLCNLRLGECTEALRHADTALKLYPECSRPIYAKAEALYAHGEFEKALVFYHRGQKIRPDQKHFKQGIYKAQDALENSIGKNVNIHLTKEGDLTFFAEQIDNTRTPILKGAKMTNLVGQMLLARRDKQAMSQSADTSATALEYKEESRNATAKKLLGQMYKDRIFLKKVFKTNDLTTDVGVDLHKIMHEGLTFLAKRTEFWRQQHPLYTEEQLTRRKQSFHHHVGRTSRVHTILLREFEGIEDLYHKHQPRAGVKRAKRVLDIISNLGTGSMRNREAVVANLHSLLGNGFLEMRHFHAALHHHKLDRQIGKQHNMPDIAKRANDNIGRCYARMGEYKKAIETWTLNLDDAKSAMERVWLNHEIGRCYMELGKYSQALDHGEEAADCVDADDDPIWEVNVSVLMAQALFKLKDYAAANPLFERALKHALNNETLVDKSLRHALKIACVQTRQKINEMREGARRKRKLSKKKRRYAMDDKEGEVTPEILHPPDYHQSFSFKSPITRRISPSVISSGTSAVSPRSPRGGSYAASPMMSLLSVGATRSPHTAVSFSSSPSSMLSDSSTRISSRTPRSGSTSGSGSNFSFRSYHSFHS